MDLEKYLSNQIKEHGKHMTNAKLALIDRHLKRVRFYQMLERLGYNLLLKPVKSFENGGGNMSKKANYDVDMAFYMMKDLNDFDSAIVLSGDGDFLPVLKHLRNNKKDVLVLSRGPRTAKEIRKFAGGEFRDFEYLRTHLEYEEEEET